MELGWQERVYLTVTGRNDWDSSLSNTAQQSFFYPSVGMSTILSKMLKLPKFVGLLEVPVPHGLPVGSAISPNISSAWRYEYVLHWYLSYGYFTSFQITSIRAYELLGSRNDAHLFKEAMSVKFTLYQSDTKNQTFLRSITLGGAFNREYIQAGDVRNRGFRIECRL